MFEYTIKKGLFDLYIIIQMSLPTSIILFKKCVIYFLGGHAAYSDAIKLSDGFSEKGGTVKASSFFLFHTVLKTSKDFYESMRWVKLIG